MIENLLRTGAAAAAALTVMLSSGAAAATRSSSIEITVRADQGWQPATSDLRAGQSFAITYRSGAWTVDHRNFPSVGLAGYDNAIDQTIYQGCKVLSDQTYGHMLARTGKSAPFVIDRNGTFVAPAAGPLQFRINDDDRCLVDNAGVILLAVDATAASPGGSGPAPGSAPGATIYTADWSSGLNGWVGDTSWKPLRGALLNDGTSSSSLLLAPYDTGHVTDYAVEARMRVIRMGHSFGLVTRRSPNDAGYGASDNEDDIVEIRYGYAAGEVLDTGRRFQSGDGWHMYRVEANGNVVTFFIDGAKFATTTDNRYLGGGLTGIYSDQTQLEVSSFTIRQLV